MAQKLGGTSPEYILIRIEKDGHLDLLEGVLTFINAAALRVDQGDIVAP